MKTFTSTHSCYPILLITASIYLSGCSIEIEDKTSPCNEGGQYRAAIKNNIIYRDKINETFLACLERSNKNRDVKYNDSSEVVQSCQEVAFNLYGGILGAANDPFFADIQNNIMKCEGLK